MLCRVFVSVAVTAGALRVDEDAAEQAQTRTWLQARASAGSTLHTLMDHTLPRKQMSPGQESAVRRLEKGAHAESEALTEQQWDQQGASRAHTKIEAAKAASAAAGVASAKARATINEKREEEKQEWTLAETKNGEEKAAIQANKREAAETASAQKLLLEQRARAAHSAMRRAEAMRLEAENKQFMANWEIENFEEEEDAFVQTAKLKGQEAKLQEKAADLAGERNNLEFETSKLRQKIDADAMKEDMERQALEEAKLSGSEAEVKKAKEEREKYEEEAANAKKAMKNLQEEAYTKEKARLDAEEEATKTAGQARTVMAKSFAKRAFEEANTWKVMGKRLTDTAKDYADLVGRVGRKADKEAASAASQKYSAEAAYATSIENELDKEVEERKAAMVAAHRKEVYELDAYKADQKEADSRTRADQAAQDEAKALAAGKKVEADTSAATAARYNAEERYYATQEKIAKEAALKFEAQQEEHTKNSEELRLKADDVKKLQREMPCANEHGVCVCKGTVVYGRRFMEGQEGQIRTFAETMASAVRARPCGSSLICSNVVFGDPSPGAPKHCFCREVTGDTWIEGVVDETATLAHRAMAMARQSERMLYTDQMKIDSILARGQELGEQAVESADESNRQLLKQVQNSENQAVRIKVEQGVGEVGYDDMDHHDMMGSS